jgi:hypothetical protein
MKKFNLIFKYSGYISLIGWILLIGFPMSNFTDQVVTYISVVLLCFIYSYLIILSKNATDEKFPKGSFWSFQGVVNLFKNPKSILIGWIHFLAFDLMVGMYIKNDAIGNDISFWLVIPILLLTLMLGPMGLLAYFLMRFLFLQF